MEFLSIYALFALAVAVLSNLAFTGVVLRRLRIKGVENVITEHPVLLHISTLIINMLIAPIMAAVLLSTDKTTRFTFALEDALAQD